jgi:tyrosine aminotransferase
MTIQTKSPNERMINDTDIKSCTTTTNCENCPTNSDPPWYDNIVQQQQHELSSLTLPSSPTGVAISPTLSLFQHRQHNVTFNTDIQPQPSSLLFLSPTSTTDVLPEVKNEINEWPIFPMSSKAKRTKNPIRAILDSILNGTNNAANLSGKEQISLALGDPIASGAGNSNSSSSTISDMDPTNTTKPLMPCPNAIRAVQDLLQKENTTAAASYTTAIGTMEGRTAIAKYHSHPYYTYNPNDDIIIANGCSGALELLLSSLLETNNANSNDESSILLVPVPGFPLYRVIAESHGATVLSYPLLPEKEWEIDIEQLHQIIQNQQQQLSTNEVQHHQQQNTNNNDNNMNKTTKKHGGRIRGIVINNPSNPTGAVYTKHHLQQIVQICQQYHIPIIADEIYGDMIFTNKNPTIRFTSLAEIAAQMGQIVPVITASGIGKQFLLPGWRIGWICFQDK